MARETTVSDGCTVTILTFPGNEMAAPGDTSTDVDLVARILQNREHEAFRVLVQRYQKMLWGLFWRGTGNREDSEELVQEVFYRAWRSLAEYRPEHKFHTWLYTIAINCLRSHLKKHRFRQSLLLKNSEHNNTALETVADLSGTPDNVLHETETQRLVSHLLSRLRERYRLPLIMHYFDGQSVSLISEMLGVPENTVKTHLKRGRDEIERMIRANPEIEAMFSGPRPGELEIPERGGRT